MFCNIQLIFFHCRFRIIWVKRSNQTSARPVSASTTRITGGTSSEVRTARCSFVPLYRVTRIIKYKNLVRVCGSNSSYYTHLLHFHQKCIWKILDLFSYLILNVWRTLVLFSGSLIITCPLCHDWAYFLAQNNCNNFLSLRVYFLFLIRNKAR